MNVVVIGGGTGSFTVLRGIKRYKDWNISAVVSMFDNGGSTGKLRDEYGVLPPGDVRRCLIALSEEEVLRELFEYRFQKDSSVNGHSMGNLVLTALGDIMGSDEAGIEAASKILRIKGRVLPVSTVNAHLCAKFEDDSVITGETLIDIPKRDPNLRIKEVYLRPAARINPAVADVIRNADLIIAGPGDLYTSVIPNLLVRGMTEALEQSSARKLYVCNLMTKPGETQGYAASDHLAEVRKYGFRPDIMLCSNSTPSADAVERYARENQKLVEVDESDVKLVKADITSGIELVRHDSYKLADVIKNLVMDFKKEL
ncbi:YvcK family protein [Candidatus Woesearchaeota archaeon]|nr:YvcK family protein [Candidatus Woesearchaeota archaeon]